MTTEKHQSHQHHGDASTEISDAEKAKAAAVEAAKVVKKEVGATDGGGDQGNPNPH